MLVTDVFVAGGGPAGLAAAVAARSRGFDVIVADASVPPIDKACGEGIMPDGLAAAESLGITLEPADGFAFRGIRFCDGERSVEAAFPAGKGLGVRRTALHSALAGRCAELGVRLMWDTKITGMAGNRVALDRGTVQARWIIGADGSASRIRQWAGLADFRRDRTRFGFRTHFRIAPWSEYMEIHWGRRGQIYVTPVSQEEICVVAISRDSKLRLREALTEFPSLERRLNPVLETTVERGGASITCRLRAVHRGNVALIGDASGSVDAITGEGLCLVFQQAQALADALAADDLSLYEKAHRAFRRRPTFMADLMLSLERRHRVRAAVVGTFSRHPQWFARLLALHVGAVRPATARENPLRAAAASSGSRA